MLSPCIAYCFFCLLRTLTIYLSEAESPALIAAEKSICAPDSTVGRTRGLRFGFSGGSGLLDWSSAAPALPARDACSDLSSVRNFCCSAPTQLAFEGVAMLSTAELRNLFDSWRLDVFSATYRPRFFKFEVLKLT